MIGTILLAIPTALLTIAFLAATIPRLLEGTREGARNIAGYLRR